MQRRKITPPTAVHPALRDNFSIENSVPHSGPTGVRDSDLTTMSEFIKASAQTPPTPPMLVPRDCVQAYPTDRGFIEDRREQLLHEHSGSDTERTPVFVYTPNISSSEFSKSTSHTTPKKKKVGVLDWVASTEQTKSPRKGILEKLRFTTPRSSQATTPNTTNRGYYSTGEALPPKVKAVLSNSPHKANLGRSPSKKKGLFSRKTSEQPSIETQRPAPTYVSSEPRSAGALTVTFSDSTGKTPQTAHTAFSDPTYDRHGHSKRAVSQTHSDQGGAKHQTKDKSSDACGVSRSQSLQYFDRTMPPTPPAKNTPPHEKELKAQEKARMIMEHHQKKSEQHCLDVIRDMTPQKEVSQEIVQRPSSRLKSPLHHDIFDEDTPTRTVARLMGTDGRTSPTKFGNYGRKEMPTLVKQPSVYSMHACFYPDLHDQCSYEEMKRRADGLGLEGLSELPDGFYDREPIITYSPSIYSDGFGGRPNSVIQTSPGMFKHSPSLPAVLENHHRMTPSKTSLQEKKSGSSHGTIPLVYPDLASDPSRTDLGATRRTHHRSNSDIAFPVHSRTHSPKRSRSPPRKTITDDFADLHDDVPLSPPNYSCPSAMPSPLVVLPTSVFTTPLKLTTDALPASPSSTKTLTPSRSRGRIENLKSTGSPIARTPTSPFDNLPTLSPSIKPSPSILPPAAAPNHQPEPQKLDRGSSPISDTTTTGTQHDQPRPRSPGRDTLDRMQIMLRRMESQATEITSLRAELDAMGARLAHRPEPPTPALSSAAGSDVGHAASVAGIDDPDEVIGPFGSYVPDGGLAQLGLNHRLRQQRVDQEWDTNDLAHIDRYYESEKATRSKNEAKGAGQGANRFEDIIDALGFLTRKVKDLEEASKDGK